MLLDLHVSLILIALATEATCGQRTHPNAVPLTLVAASRLDLTLHVLQSNWIGRVRRICYTEMSPLDKWKI